ncbi:MAG: hypothetical protein GY731_05430, partial [Gammaproteobacteria bacterium]|nr:hypothetical protein [Gammaproteobacteria bacterium]
SAAGKIHGEANVALLKRLGATPWKTPNPSDCVLLVGISMDCSDVDAARIIVINGEYTGGDSDVALSMADPLETNGSMLNRDGDLAVLRCTLPDSGNQDGHGLLARLAGLDNLSDLGILRGELAGEISELAVLKGLNGERLIKTELQPVLEPVAPDSRESAFASHLEQLGLAAN